MTDPKQVELDQWAEKYCEPYSCPQTCDINPHYCRHDVLCAFIAGAKLMREKIAHYVAEQQSKPEGSVSVPEIFRIGESEVST